MHSVVERESSSRILIVEDEVAIALDVEGMLRDAGYDPVGPAVTPDHARDLLALGSIDCAVLDLGMLQHSNDDILRSLMEEHIPFIYLTGYGSADVPADFPPATILLKPSHLPDLILSIQSLFGESLD
jgi:DNA-binding NtrC family response regulator